MFVFDADDVSVVGRLGAPLPPPTMAEEELLVIFDVHSLFTNVLVDKRLMEDETLEDRTTLTLDEVNILLGICLRTTYFVYDSSMSKQAEQQWGHLFHL